MYHQAFVSYINRVQTYPKQSKLLVLTFFFAIFISSIYISKDQFTFLSVRPSVCVRYVWKGGVHTVRTENKKKYFKNAQSPIIDGRLLDRPDRRYGNPLKPDRTHDDVGKKLGQCDRRQISANFPRPYGSISFDFRRIRRYDVTTKPSLKPAYKS